MVAVFEAQYQDSGFREFEADAAKHFLDVVGPAIRRGRSR